MNYSFMLGHSKFFKKMSEEEREHAQKFMEYQNKRGGTVVLLDIKVKQVLASHSRLRQPIRKCSLFSLCLETNSTKLGVCFGSTRNGFTIGKGCVSSIIGVTCICFTA